MTVKACAIDGCVRRISSSTKSADSKLWFHGRIDGPEEGRSYCPDHLPDWVADWRARKKLPPVLSAPVQVQEPGHRISNCEPDGTRTECICGCEYCLEDHPGQTQYDILRVLLLDRMRRNKNIDEAFEVDLPWSMFIESYGRTVRYEWTTSGVHIEVSAAKSRTTRR